MRRKYWVEECFRDTMQGLVENENVRPLVKKAEEKVLLNFLK